MTSIADVIDQMAGAGLPLLPPGHPKLNGKYNRFGPQKKAWYILREVELKSGKAVITGAFGIFQGENRNTVPVVASGETLTEEERADFAVKQKQQEEKEATKKKNIQEWAASRAKMDWNKAKIIEAAGHPYLVRKQVSAENVRINDKGELLVPMKRYALNGSHMVGRQRIDAEGNKLYSKGMDKIGAACLLGSIKDAPIIAIGEGYATCRSARMAVAKSYDLPVMAAFDAGNILTVAQGLRRDFPDAHLLFLADDDYLLLERFIERLREEFKVSALVDVDGQTHKVIADNGDEVDVMAIWRTDMHGIEYIEADIRCGRIARNYTYKNAGVAVCTAAAKSVGNASVVIPHFTDRAGRKWTDFNDLHVEESLSVVEAQIAFAIHAAQQPNPISPAPSGATSEATEAVANTDVVKFSDFPPPPWPEGEQPDFFAEGAGEAQKTGKDKPKKVYGQEHWDQVEFVLKNFILIYGEDMVWDVQQRMLMKISSMRTIVSNHDVMKFWGGEARHWVLKKNIVFDPSEKPSPAQTGAEATVNLFSGWKMKPKAGAFIKIQTLLAHLCDGNEELMQWVERWLAYPLRNRGAKMETSIIMHGDEGSGKNFFFEKVIKKIYGEYGYVIGNAQLESQFNDWASMRLFMVADEVVTRSELKHMKGKLKYLVSGESIIVNPKGLPEHSEANHINFVFLSNELIPLALDKTDRRYLVIWTPPALTKEFYIEVAQEIANGGIEAFYHYLMHDLDMGDFSEQTKPIYNDAKDALIEKSLAPPERFYREWSGGFLPLPFISCGVTQLYEAYKTWCERSGESRYISQTLFSPTVARYAGDALEKRQIKYEMGSVVKQRWVFLAGNKPDGKTLSEWVAGASALFESDLKAYKSRSIVDVTP